MKGLIINLISHLSVDQQLDLLDYEILSVTNNIALAKLKEDWCIIEILEDSVTVHRRERHEAHLIYNDYLNQVVYEEKAKINWELK